MSDRNEVACRNCGSFLHFADQCPSANTSSSVAQHDRVVERLHGLLELLAGRFRGYLPWPAELRDAVVRGHEYAIDDTIKKADELLEQYRSATTPAATERVEPPLRLHPDQLAEIAKSPSVEKCSELEGTLDAIEDYLAEREDVRDGPDGEQRPNQAMSLLADLRRFRATPPGKKL